MLRVTSVVLVVCASALADSKVAALAPAVAPTKPRRVNSICFSCIEIDFNQQKNRQLAIPYYFHSVFRRVRSFGKQIIDVGLKFGWIIQPMAVNFPRRTSQLMAMLTDVKVDLLVSRF